PVVAEAEGLVLAAGKDGIQEDAAEGDLGPTLVAERVVHYYPDARAGNEVLQQGDQQQTHDLVPVPDGLGEEAEGGGVVLMSGAAGGLPDAGDRTPAQADDPGGGHGPEGREDLLAEGRGERG